ncbi:MAG: 50S ribosomal protein L18 [Candidatus Schekmanbacteria bacterium]|nr:50S ribosomal protein L18 [Candidatus Schekmanbacteria bacterium]
MGKEKKSSGNYRHERVRKKVKGSSDRPRLCVFKSLKHLYAQIIDDENGHTLVSFSTVDKAFKTVENKRASLVTAKVIGEQLAVRAREKGISKVVFDRGGYPYHGQVKVLADAAREKGLVF